MAIDKQLHDIATRSVTFGDKRGTSQSFTCKYCDRTFVGETTRIVSHQLGMGGGIAACVVSTHVMSCCMKWPLVLRQNGPEYDVSQS